MTMNVETQHRILAQLRRDGWLTPDRYALIVTAGDRSPRHDNELLEFGAAVGYLQRDQVPVMDTVRMAQSAGRRLNLRWSRRRWREEHDSLSRQLTARMRREQEDVRFETSWLADALRVAELPATASFSIFSSGLDLVRESELQHHCIVTYLDRFRSACLGGLALELDGKRWTITIRRPTGSTKATIDAIYGRRNAKPSHAERTTILHCLGPEIVEAVPTTNVEPAAPRARTELCDYPIPRRLVF